jgi:hypothetical protein
MPGSVFYECNRSRKRLNGKMSKVLFQAIFFRSSQFISVEPLQALYELLRSHSLLKERRGLDLRQRGNEIYPDICSSLPGTSGPWGCYKPIGQVPLTGLPFGLSFDGSMQFEVRATHLPSFPNHSKEEQWRKPLSA